MDIIALILGLILIVILIIIDIILLKIKEILNGDDKNENNRFIK